MAVSNTRPCRMRRSLLGMAVVSALGLYVGSSVEPAHAQSSYGSIYGNAKAGDTVHVKSVNTGQTQDVVVGGNGQYVINGLALGRYEITLVEGGATLSNQQATVIAGSSTQVNFGPVDAKNMQAINVTAPSANAVDVKSTTVRTVFTAEQLESLPIPRDVLAVAALTPGTVSNGTFGAPSFGGSSSAENSYYIDGFNVTDMYNSLSFNKVPWFAIAQEDVQTGGYGPEYGFSTGGVVSVNTKQGTNTWQGGFDVQLTPATGQGHIPNEYYSNGQLLRSYDSNSNSQTAYSAWIGGPLIKDKLFFFGAAQFTGSDSQSFTNGNPVSSSNLPTGGYGGPQNAGAHTTHSSAPYYLGRVDWNISDNNTASWTTISDVTHEAQRIYDLTYTGNQPYFGNYNGTANFKSGGKVNVFKDVWQLADGLTLTAMYGQSKYFNPNEGNPQSVFSAATGTTATYNGVLGQVGSSCPSITDQRAGVLSGAITHTIQGCSVVPTLSTTNPVDEHKTGTLNLEWVVGNHDIVGGISKDSFTSQGGSSESAYTYLTDDAAGDATGVPNKEYAQQLLFQTSASVGIHSTSAYLKDAWTIDDNWLFNYGLRYDKFSDFNGSGETFIKLGNILQPRLGLSWDVYGDSSLKIYASAGRYALPVDSGVALRAGSPSI